MQVVRLAPDEMTNTVVPIALTHFQGGYLDFMPHEMQMRTQSGPPRTSMLDDICFYIRTYANLINTGTPEGVLLFAKKIVASHYLQHAQFMRSIISTTQFHMSRKAAIRLEQFSGEFVEAQWSDGQALERRMCEYCEDLEGIMLQCRVPFDPPHLDHVKSWQDITTDFQFLHRRLCDLRHRAESLNSATIGLAGMAGNQQSRQEQALSLREAKNMKTLTLLGLIFIPLALISSIFSMSQPYGPGGDQFWVYFVVSCPLVLLVLGMFYLVNTKFKLGVFNKVS